MSDQENLIRKIDSIEESARELHVRVFGEGAIWQNHLLTQITQIKWILAALLALLLWRSF